MAFNINDIRATIANYDGVHKPSHFFVRVTPPPFLAGDSYTRDIEFLCDATNLPGIHFDTAPIRPLGYGNQELRPYDSVFSPVRCDFFVDNKREFFNFFHKWMGNINNFGRDIQNASDNTRLNHYEFAYPKEYEGVVDIYLMSGDGFEVTSVKLEQAFPMDISDLGLAWEINDTISRISVTFAYSVWSSETLPFNEAARPIGERIQALRNGQPSFIPSFNDTTVGDNTGGNLPSLDPMGSFTGQQTTND